QCSITSKPFSINMDHGTRFVIVLATATSVYFFFVLQDGYHGVSNRKIKGFLPIRQVTAKYSTQSVIQNNLYGCTVRTPDKSLLPDNIKEGKTNRKERHLSFPTDYQTSVVEIINPQKYYNICDNIAIRIQARGANGSMKAYGGDYFRIKLFTEKPGYSAVGPDYFFDYENGTYVALFTLRWTGTVRVYAKLVHPSEAVEILNRTTEGSASTVFTFHGEFKTQASDGKNHSEIVICGVAPFEPPMCNVSATQTHGPWFCMYPKNKKLSCKDWTTISMNPNSRKQLEGTLSTQELAVFRRTKVHLNTTLLPSIEVRGTPPNETNLPTCNLPSVPPTIQTNGYFYNNSWRPLNCRVNHFEDNDIGTCLQGKSIHIYGDSTGRQMYDYLQASSRCVSSQNHPYMKSCEKDNLSMQFRFHGPPVRGRQVIPVKTLRYVAEQIDDL
ncbi:hypothetical protein BSL78_05958, partial [Apostichopus japonicus]